MNKTLSIVLALLAIYQPSIARAESCSERLEYISRNNGKKLAAVAGTSVGASYGTFALTIPVLGPFAIIPAFYVLLKTGDKMSDALFESNTAAMSIRRDIDSEDAKRRKYDLTYLEEKVKMSNPDASREQVINAFLTLDNAQVFCNEKEFDSGKEIIEKVAKRISDPSSSLDSYRRPAAANPVNSENDSSDNLKKNVELEAKTEANIDPKPADSPDIERANSAF